MNLRARAGCGEAKRMFQSGLLDAESMRFISVLGAGLINHASICRNIMADL